VAPPLGGAGATGAVGVGLGAGGLTGTLGAGGAAETLVGAGGWVVAWTDEACGATGEA